MNWPRIILDGISMSLLFNAVVLLPTRIGGSGNRAGTIMFLGLMLLF